MRLTPQGPTFIPWQIVVWGAITFIAVPLLAVAAVILIDRMRWWRLEWRARRKR